MKKIIINKNFWKKKNSYVTVCIIALIIIVGSIGLLIHFINKRDYNLKYQVNYFDLNMVDKRTGANIYLDLYAKPILVDYYSNKNNDLFYVELNNKFYFIQSDTELIDEIKITEYQSGRRIVGNVFKMDDKTRREVISFIEDMKGIKIKDTEVEKYISSNVFDYNPYYYMLEYFMAVFIAFVFSIICIFNYVKYIYRFNKNIKKFTKEELDEINISVNDKESIYTECGYNNYIDGIYLCNKYMIDTKTFDLYNYSDIEMISFKKRRTNGGIDTYRMILKLRYSDRYIKTSIVSDEFKEIIEKYINDKKLNIIISMG